jgi:hypothetical protein
MKRVIACVFALALVAAAVAFLPPSAAVSAAAAGQPIRVVLDGRELAFDAPPRIVNNRTLVPVRGVFEAMGATVLWNGDTRTVTALRLDSVVKLVIGSKEARVDKQRLQLDVHAQLIENRTFVPLRFISENIGADVGWDGAARTVTITTDKAHWSDPGDNLSLSLLFTSEWVDMDTGGKMSFDPEMFIQISDAWPSDPEGLFYSYSETYEPARNIVGMFLDGAHLKDHWLEFDPDARILTEYVHGDALTRWRIGGGDKTAYTEDYGHLTQEQRLELLRYDAWDVGNPWRDYSADDVYDFLAWYANGQYGLTITAEDARKAVSEVSDAADYDGSGEHPLAYLSRFYHVCVYYGLYPSQEMRENDVWCLGDEYMPFGDSPLRAKGDSDSLGDYYARG